MYSVTKEIVMKNPWFYSRPYTYSAAKQIIITTVCTPNHIPLYMYSGTTETVITKVWSSDNALLYTYKAARRL
jgi:hypothetical protein